MANRQRAGQCDPNIFYDTRVPGRWIGRASRHIKKGEELTITYIPVHGLRAERREALKGWSFVCACEMCTSQRDTYTDSLRRLVGIPETETGPVYEDTIEDRIQQTADRVNYLLSAVQALSSDETATRETTLRRRELVYA